MRLQSVNGANLSADDFVLAKATDLASGQDFGGGGTGDLLLQQDSGGIRTLQLVQMNANTAQAVTTLAKVGTDWNVDGAGDFNRDGDSDILLHQDSGGVRNLLAFEMQGNLVQAAHNIGQIGADWQIGNATEEPGASTRLPTRMSRAAILNHHAELASYRRTDHGRRRHVRGLRSRSEQRTAHQRGGRGLGGA